MGNELLISIFQEWKRSTLRSSSHWMVLAFLVVQYCIDFGTLLVQLAVWEWWAFSFQRRDRDCTSQSSVCLWMCMPNLWIQKKQWFNKGFFFSCHWPAFYSYLNIWCYLFGQRGFTLHIVYSCARLPVEKLLVFGPRVKKLNFLSGITIFFKVSQTLPACIS